MNRKKQPAVKKSDVAIIGMAGFFPNANSIRELWVQLEQNNDCLSDIATSGRDLATRLAPYANLEGFPKRAGLIDHAETFDAEFFNISPKEAELMCPQQRKSLELVETLLEDGGYHPKAIAGNRIGVFWAYHINGYNELLVEENIPLDPTMNTGINTTSLANRISYTYDLMGPSETINTGCSGSLVAIHKAVQSIRDGSSEMAIAGGVNLLLSARTFECSFKAGMLSPSGACRTLDEYADGFVRSEGCCGILLKCLSKAITDQDSILAIVKGSATGHGGKTRGFTVPSEKGQVQVIRRALDDADADPTSISYVELHGTGTNLGDPIEIKALKEAFRKNDDEQIRPKEYCGIGSVKSNLGHLESASGIAGLIKVVLQLRNRKLVSSIHIKQTNSFIRLENSPFFALTKNKPWNRIRRNGFELPRCAGVSSFGLGGTLSHVIVEEYVEEKPAPQNRTLSTGNATSTVIVLSALNKAQLKTYAERLRIYLVECKNKNPAATGNPISIDSPYLKDIAFTLQVGRKALKYRVAFVVKSVTELNEKLKIFIDGKATQETCYEGRICMDRKGARSLARVESEQQLNTNTDQWLRNGNGEKLAKLWTKGVDIDWLLYYQDRTPRRIHLPTYPFSRDRYWFSAVDKGREFIDDAKPAPFTYVLDWQCSRKQDLTPSNQNHDGEVVIFHTQNNFEFEQSLLAKYPNAHLISVDRGIPDISTIKPPKTIYFLGGLSANIVGDNFCEFTPAQEKTTITLFRLVKALENHANTQNSLTLIVLTQDAQAVRRTVNPFSAGLCGLTLSLTKEYPHWNIKQIDLSSQDLSEIDRHKDLIDLVDTQAFNPRGYPIAIRRGIRYYAKLTPINVSEQPSSKFRRQGIYVILGGAGGLGVAFSQYLIETYDARLIWIGRRTYDKSIEEICARLGKIGEKPRYIQADACDLAELKAAVTEIKGQHDCIHGVIHSTVVLNDKTVANMSESMFRSTLESKTLTSVNLTEVFKNEALDWLCFFSSAQSILGAPGISNYCAGCTFVDCFTRYLEKYVRFPVYTVNWGYWGDIGVVANNEYRQRMKQQGIESLTMIDGAMAFEYVLNHRVKQLVPLKLTNKGNEQLRLYDNQPDETKPTIDAPDTTSFLSATKNVRTTKISFKQDEITIDVMGEIIRGQLTAALKLPDGGFPTDISFSDLGVDSIIGIDFIQRINNALSIQLNINAIIEHSTIEKLTHHVFEIYSKRQRVEGAQGNLEKSNSLDKKFSPSIRRANDHFTSTHSSANQAESANGLIGSSPIFSRANHSDELWWPLPDQLEFTWLAAYLGQKQFAVSAYLESVEEIKPRILERTINRILKNQPLLYARLSTTQPRYKILPFKKLTVDYRDLTENEQSENIVLEHYRKNSLSQFDLNRVPLLVAELFRTGKSKFVCQLTAPHSIIDGYSMYLLVKMVNEEYRRAADDSSERDYRMEEDYLHWVPFYQAQLQTNWSASIDSIDYHSANYNPMAFSRKHVAYRPKTKWISHQKTYPLSTLGKFRQVEQRISPTSSALLAGLSALACATITGQHRFSSGYFYHGRNFTGSASVVGPMMKYIFLNFSLPKSRKLDDYVEQIRKLSNQETYWQEMPFIGNMAAIARNDNRAVDAMARILNLIIDRKHLSNPLHRHYFSKCAISHFYQSRLERYLDRSIQRMDLIVNDMTGINNSAGTTPLTRPFTRSKQKIYHDGWTTMDAISITSFIEGGYWQLIIRSRFLRPEVEGKILEYLDTFIHKIITNSEGCLV